MTKKIPLHEFINNLLSVGLITNTKYSILIVKIEYNFIIDFDSSRLRYFKKFQSESLNNLSGG